MQEEPMTYTRDETLEIFSTNELNNTRSFKLQESFSEHQDSKCRRVFVLLTSITLWAGVRSTLDFPQIYSDFLKEYFSVSSIQIEYMYSLIYIPNIVLAFVGTLIIGKIGAGNTAISCQVVTALGLIFKLVAVNEKHFPFMLIGRALLGLGMDIAFMA